MTWVHTRRPAHQRRMASAASHCERAAYLRRSVRPVDGFVELGRAIELVVRCGCDREHWDPIVQEMVGDR